MELSTKRSAWEADRRRHMLEESERENVKLDELLRTAAEAVCSEVHGLSVESGDAELAAEDPGLCGVSLASADGERYASADGDQASEDSQQFWDMRWANMLQVLDDGIGAVEAAMDDEHEQALPASYVVASSSATFLVQELGDSDERRREDIHAASDAAGAEAGRRLFRVAMML